MCLQGVVEKEQGVHQLPTFHQGTPQGRLILGYPPSAQSDTIAILEGNKNKEWVNIKVVVAHHLSNQGEQYLGGGQLQGSRHHKRRRGNSQQNDHNYSIIRKGELSAIGCEHLRIVHSKVDLKLVKQRAIIKNQAFGD